MEVSGKKQNGSPECFRCQPCSADGEDVEADGFCQNCHEYLCRTCVKYHLKVTLSKHHVILDKDKMPKNTVPQTTKQLCTETCEKHVLEVIKFFCKDHDMIGCGTCMVFDHKSCNVDFIPDVADDFVRGAEYKKLFSKLEHLRSKVVSANEYSERKKETGAKAYATAIEEIRKFRKEIEVHLDQMERNIIEECDRLKKENEQAIDNLDCDLKSFGTELDGIHGRLTAHSKQAGDLFVQAKQTNVRLNQLEDDMKHASNHTLKNFEFERNKDVEDIVSKESPLGKLVSQTATFQLLKSTKIVDFVPVYTCDINVKSPSDGTNVRISSMIAISRDTLLCVDRDNDSVKVVDTEDGCICSEIRLTSGPWDITSMVKDEVAVTIPDDQKIGVLLLKGKELSCSRSMKVRGKCRGIAYSNNTLIVSYEDSKIQILSLSGEVLQYLDVGNKNGGSLLWPGCVDVGIRGDCMFVSDLQRNHVFKIAFDGKVLCTYKNASLKYPRALTVCGDGSVLVCSNKGHTVHLMSPDCRNIKLLLTGDDAKYAFSVCYNEITSTLYLHNYVASNSTSRRNVIRVYKHAQV